MILGSLVAFAPLALDLYLPALPALSSDLGASTTSTQLTLTACLLGLAVGQLLAGPVSDSRGRRLPLLIGLAGFTVVSLLCALAPSVWALIALRFLQGLGGGAGVVIARAVVRDRHSGLEAARVFGLMMMVTGVAPILAPTLGALVLHLTSWRGTFAALAVLGGLIFVTTLIGLPESLPPARRRVGGLAETLSVFRTLLHDRSFVGYAASAAFPFGAMFAYIGGSPFVLQEVYGLSPAGFGVVFGVNAIGITSASLVSTRLVRRIGPRPLLRIGLIAGSVGAAAFLASIVIDAGLAAFLASLFVVVAAIGFIAPNATALALADHPDASGSASALLGMSQLAVGAVAAPLVGVAGAGDALPLGIVIVVLEGAALLAFVRLTHRASGPSDNASGS